MISNNYINNFELKFYQQLNDEILNTSFSNKFSRKTKRDLDKKRKLDDKINYIQGEPFIHKQFIENLIQEYSDDKVNTDINFDELKTMYQKNKEIALMIYFLKSIDNHEWGKKKTLEELIEFNTVKSTENKEQVQETPKFIQNKTEKKIMNINEKYLGFISKNYNYYNFHPKFKWETNKWIYMENCFDEFPSKGNINICYENKYFLSNLVNGKWYIIEINSSELEENYDEEKKIRQTHFKWKYQNGKITSDVSKENIYKVAQAKDLNFSQKQIDIYGEENFSFVDEEEVFLKKDDRYYGPFVVNHRNKYNNVEFSYYLENNSNNKYYKEYYTPDDFYFEKEIKGYPKDIKGYSIVQIKNFTPKIESFITDNILLQKLSEEIKGINVLENIGQSVEKYNNSIFNTTLPAQIQEETQRHIEDILNTFKTEEIYSEKFQTLIVDILSGCMDKEDEKFISWIQKYILDNDELNTKLQNLRITKNKLDDLQNNYHNEKERVNNLKEEISSKENEIKELNDKINKINIKSQEILSQELSNEYREKLEQLKKGIAEKETLLAVLIEKIGTINDYNEIKQKVEEKQNEYKSIVNMENEQNKVIGSKNNEIKGLDEQLKEKQDELQKQKKKAIQEAINSVKSSPEKIAFDGMLSNKLIEAAATWDEKNEAEKYNKIVKFNNTLNSRKNEKTDMKNYILRKIQQQRPQYSQNDILNILICLSQGFLTIFSGEPGTGKTSICNIIADTLSLTSLNEKVGESSNFADLKNSDINRYISISVERGWTSKRDFLGYYNPLTKTFDKNNRTMYDAFKTMEFEHKESDNFIMPFMVLLDEANLSPMEYYWGDFMKCFDDSHKDNMMINLGEDYQFKIYDNLRFVATINNDHTTEQLSPRLLDRAWVITLPKYSRFLQTKDNFDIPNKDIPTDIGNISWIDFQNIFKTENSTELSKETNDILAELDEIFNSMSISISHRVWDDVENYIKVGREFFEVDNDGRALDKPEISALDNAVAQRLLPKINFGIEFESKFKELKDLCSEKNSFKKSSRILERIEKKAQSNHYYSFFY